MSQEYPKGWEILYSQNEIAEATNNLIEEISKTDGITEKPVILIQILESARVFAENLRSGLAAKNIKVRVESIKASSYSGEPGEQSGLKINGLENIKLFGDEIILVVDDMVDSGNTMKETIEQVKVLADSAPVFATVLLQKICSIFKPDFAAIKDCPNRWVAGHGINGNSPDELGEQDGRDLLDIIAKVQNSELQ